MKIQPFISNLLDNILGSCKSDKENNITKILTRSTSSKTAVILIDMQENFLGRIDKKRRTEMIKNQIIIIRLCAQLDIPLFVLEYRQQPKTIEELKEEIAKVPRKCTITKHRDNGFIKTKLAEKLKELNINKVLLMGVNATACVLRTGAGAIKNGFNIITCNRLIADPDHFPDPNDMSWFKQNGIYKNNLNGIIKTLN